ncbi:MAG TPA: TonB-dependent receptor plug domain-containing protein [Longimicrobiales bacterium]
MLRTIASTLLLASLAACASAPGGGSAGGSRDVLTAAEISEHPDIRNAYDAVQRLRPLFLRQRGQTSIRNYGADQIKVYVDGVQAGGIEFLRQINITAVKVIRYLDARDATTRYGPGHAGGVIEVTTGA